MIPLEKLAPSNLGLEHDQHELFPRTRYGRTKSERTYLIHRTPLADCRLSPSRTTFLSR